jgi:hypothetical protein
MRGTLVSSVLDVPEIDSVELTLGALEDDRIGTVTVTVTVLGVPRALSAAKRAELLDTGVDVEFPILGPEVPYAIKVGKGGRNGCPSFSKLV